jgi:pimeloyl-ACP methyl ester carboxylesterase
MMNRRFNAIDRRAMQFCMCFILVLVFNATTFSQATSYQSLTADVNGVRIHYLKAGTGKTPLVLLHGFGDTSRMWIPLFADFSKDYTVIAPDLRGLGDSSRPASSYDKKTAAVDIHELIKSLGYERINLVGHDIGLMVAYAYAAQYPNEVSKLALLEAPIPGVGDVWEKIYNDPRLWHFHFVDSQMSLDLVKGREGIFLSHFWDEMSAHPRAFSDSDRQMYAKAYAQDGAMRAAFEYFKAFDRQDAADNRKFAAQKLPMPVMVITGDKSMGDVLEVQARMVADNVTAIKLNDTGHWLMEERPAETKAALRKFFSSAQAAL